MTFYLGGFSMRKKILGCLLAAAMIFTTGCNAQVDYDAASGSVSVNGMPVEDCIEKAGNYAKMAQKLGILDDVINDFLGADVIYDATGKEGDGVSSDIVILHTNDVHCGVDAHIGYAGLAAYKHEMDAEGNDVFLVDAGDEIQGGTIGMLTKGEAIIRLMNDVGYDLAVPGNHDFDFGVEQLLELTKMADFPYICCNFIDLKTGEPVFQPYTIERIGGRRIAFVGAATPTSITESTPKFFCDDKGDFIYGFMQSEDGKEFYDSIQKAVDDARDDGADYCILVAHLGINATDSPYTSTEVIENTTGIDAVIDGHSHSIVEDEKVKNKDGREVILTQAGYQLPAIGKLTIDKKGNMTSELIDEYDEEDEAITEAIEKEEAAYADEIAEVVGTTDFDLKVKADDGSTWLVRNGETNMTDFVTDAYKYATGAEIAIANGGGVRADISAGEITFGDLLNVNPFSNQLVIKKVTGQELLDALEFSVSYVPDEFGGFLQVSGVTFDVDLDKDAKVKVDKDGMFAGFGSDERRVSNVKVNGKDLDKDKEYAVAGNGYILNNRGNGYTMFKGEEVPLDRYVEDIMALQEYLESMDGKMPDDYKDPDGQERIRFVNED